MEMRRATRRGRHLAPAVHENPEDETPGTPAVARVTQERAQEEDDVLVEGIELIAERLAAAEQVAADLAVDLEHERGFRFVIGIVGREEIREELAIFVNRIDRLAQESGLATKRRTASRSDGR